MKLYYVVLFGILWFPSLLIPMQKASKPRPTLKNFLALAKERACTFYKQATDIEGNCVQAIDDELVLIQLAINHYAHDLNPTTKKAPETTQQTSSPLALTPIISIPCNSDSCPKNDSSSFIALLNSSFPIYGQEEQLPAALQSSTIPAMTSAPSNNQGIPTRDTEDNIRANGIMQWYLEELSSKKAPSPKYLLVFLHYCDENNFKINCFTRMEAMCYMSQLKQPDSQQPQ